MALTGSLFCRFYCGSYGLSYFFLLLYVSMAGFDAWNVFVWTFEDLKKMMLKFEIVVFRNLCRYICVYTHYIHTIRTIYPCMGQVQAGPWALGPGPLQGPWPTAAQGPAPCADIWLLLCVYVCV